MNASVVQLSLLLAVLALLMLASRRPRGGRPA